jgi:hypothetical protein
MLVARGIFRASRHGHWLQRENKMCTKHTRKKKNLAILLNSYESSLAYIITTLTRMNGFDCKNSEIHYVAKGCLWDELQPNEE